MATRPRACITPVTSWHSRRPTVARRSTRQARASERRTNCGRRRAMSRIRIERPAASRLPVTSTNRICPSAVGAVAAVEGADGEGTGDGAVVVRGPGTLSADASVDSLIPPTPYPGVLRCACCQRRGWAGRAAVRFREADARGRGWGAWRPPSERGCGTDALKTRWIWSRHGPIGGDSMNASSNAGVGPCGLWGVAAQTRSIRSGHSSGGLRTVRIGPRRAMAAARRQLLGASRAGAPVRCRGR